MQKNIVLNSNKQIVNNTIMLYIRQILVLLVSLYTVRITLDVLGVEDFGLYNVVGGIVLLLSFLSGTMASATQRFFSFALGENDFEKLKRTFSVNLIFYLVLGLISLVLLETLGIWYIKNKLIIPFERYDAVIYLYHFSTISFIATLLTAPFTAIIIAHEDMRIYAYVAIVEVLLKLGVVFLLIYVVADKLPLYGFLIFLVTFLNLLIYIIICLKKYNECQFKRYYWDKKLFKQILNYTGWTLFGQLSTVFRTHAVTILLNQSFSPIAVASRAIATNISGRINMFASSFNLGLYPSIIKSYSSGNKDRMFELIFNGSKLTFSLMWIFALPLLIEMETILGLWLKEVPEFAILFTRLALIESLIVSISLPLTTAARAPGNMKQYELILGCMQILIFFTSWIFVSIGYPAYSVFIIAIIFNFMMFIVRLYIVSNLIGINVNHYLKQVLFPVIMIIFISAVLSFCVDFIIKESIILSILNSFISFLITSICIYFIGLNRSLRLKVNNQIRIKVFKLIKSNN
ncbi:MATE family efflux transporter [Polaribacter sp. BAL334]|uniref:MATE family efflux transporter n=1 Tax=Polaribacter sp. BAL334 TaxID=1708178 RepID=UPI0018D220C2|nr:MATE family efflux transporter [Polaribacter sp. BAL334]